MVKNGFLIIVLVALFLKSGLGQSNHNIPTIDFKTLEGLLESKRDTLIIVNFWATWCAPCVEELPYFEEMNQRLKGEKIKMYLVSLDFKRNKESRLLPFVEKHKLKAEVLHLFEPDANAWINQVDPSWSGAIPATLFKMNNKKSFHEGTLSYDELHEIIQTFLTQN